MAIKNYTSAVSVEKTVGEIHIMLARHGAKKIMFDYEDDGDLRAICFQIVMAQREQAIKLPANVARVQAVLKRQKDDPKVRNRSAIDCSKEQAERTAWRIVHDWLAAQLAILETEQVEAAQVFLPYFMDRSGRTLYEVYDAGQLLLPE